MRRLMRWLPALALLLSSISAVSITSPSVAAGTVNAHGSARQVYVTDAAPGTGLTLENSAGNAVATATVNELGGALFRDVAPGTGYRVRSTGGDLSDAITVHDESPTQWNTSIYDQEIKPGGYQYLTTRDGTKLALTVHLPTSPAGIFDTPGDDLIPATGLPYTAPYPTLIEYSGYGTARPSGPVSGIAALANVMGFAVVDVSMRGTGCSGGAFDFFEPLQNLDGYDVIETIARQPWVKNHKVGMMGISYGGISQLFTAQTRPPSLAAISPLSVIDAVPTTLFPGGIQNDGFAVAWAKERQNEAQPAGQGLSGTQPYAEEQIAKGDATCAANQALHPEAADLAAKIAANKTYDNTAFIDSLDPVTFVDKINVPVFLACQWQDEQTGGHCPTLAGRMTGTSKKWFTFTNGAHIDSLDPQTFNRLFDFLSIYVAKQPPATNAAIVKAAAPLIYQAALGTPQTDPLMLPNDPVQTRLTLKAATTYFESLPRVRVLFNNGAGRFLTSQPGDPYPDFEKSFSAWPIPGVSARSWYFGANQTLRDTAPTSGATTNRYTADPQALPRTNFTGGTGTGGLWGNASQWSWNWKQYPAGNSLGYVSAPLTADAVAVGGGRVEFWARSSTPDVDFVVTVSEIDAKGNETFVQSGYLRGSMRKLSTTTDNIFKTPSTLLEPIPSFASKDLQAMPQTDFTKVVVPMFFSGHPYRAGTRIKVSIAAPNGTQPIWAFDHTEPAIGSTSIVDVTYDPGRPSRLVLPIVTGLTASTGQPACGVLRNQPCRVWVPGVNQTLN